MARSFDLRILTPVETLLEAVETAWVHLRLVNGTGITIYPGHAPLIAETVAAPLRYADGTGEHVFNVEAGIVQVDDEEVAIFTSSKSEAAAPPRTSAVPEERHFERLARELRSRLKEEPRGTLGGVLGNTDG